MADLKQKELSLHDLFVDELADAYDSEKQLIKALPGMADAAQNAELKKAFTMHLAETREQVEILEQVFASLKLKPHGKHCDGIEGIITEGEGVIGSIVPSAVLDAGLVAGGRRAEHYEIAAYRSLLMMGEALGLTKACSLLEEILTQEEAADAKLTALGTKLMKSASKGAAVTA